MTRDGKLCPLCGYKVFNWQADEYDVIGDFCPECTMEVRYYFGDEADFDELLDSLEAVL